MERAPYNADGTLKPEVEATLSSVPEEHMTDEGYVSSMGNPTELNTRNNINKIQAVPLKVDIQSFPAWWVERAKIMNEAVRKREEDREVRRRRVTNQAA
ncbi:hypothetical protein [Ferrovum myxofaciens]|uniref:hypothetical protein n=1 Tax=Ferrovum myxofaciens TaxID=416213 RepID=UPI0004E12A4C|nr:hypothetical protein [Ferrovum myxofaciens]